MDVREKLWRFVKEAIHSWESDVNMSDHITDNLVANGVTIQRWIPIEERVPNEEDADEDFSVLAIHKATKRRSFHWRTVADSPFDFTHWMPLPEAPKEVE